MLYLVFGLLEWYESADSTDPLYSPLLSTPVELNRNKPSRTSGGMFEFSIEHTGEDLLTNLSLVERMKRDFALSILMLEDEEPRSLAARRPTWMPLQKGESKRAGRDQYSARSMCAMEAMPFVSLNGGE